MQNLLLWLKLNQKKKKARVNWSAVAELQKAEIEELTKRKEELLANLGGEGTYVPTGNEAAPSGAPIAAAPAPKAAAPKAAAPKKKKAKAKAKAAPAAEAAPAAAPAVTTDMAVAPEMAERGNMLNDLYNGLDEEHDDDQEGDHAHLMYQEEHERTPEEIMDVEDIGDLTPPELLVRAQGLEFLLESEKQLRLENEKNKDLFIEYLTDGMNNLRKKMRKLARAHELLKKRHESGK